jgi:hypothetical protein
MRDKFNITDLPIVSWNVHGIFSRHSGFRYNKLHSPFFKDAIGDAKLFGLVETHHVASEIDQIQLEGFKSLNIVRKHVFICSNPCIYTTVVQEVYKRDRYPEVDDVKGLAAAATKHLELLKQKDEAERSFIIEKIVGKLFNRTLDLFHLIYPLQDSNK